MSCNRPFAMCNEKISRYSLRSHIQATYGYAPVTGMRPLLRCATNTCRILFFSQYGHRIVVFSLSRQSTSATGRSLAMLPNAGRCCACDRFAQCWNGILLETPERRKTAVRPFLPFAMCDKTGPLLNLPRSAPMSTINFRMPKSRCRLYIFF